MHEGHRMRMLEKLKGNAKMLEPHELLEILLFNALPRVNTNPLAHRLIERFGDIKGVLNAEMDELMQVEGVGSQVAAYLKCVGLFCKECNERQPLPMPKKYENESFRQYLADHLGEQDYEVLEFYTLARDGKILNVRSFTQHDARRVNIAPSEVVKVVAESAGKAMIIVHNHIGCTSEPSDEDDKLTKQCEVLCSINNVVLMDHIIYSEYGFYSYYDSGNMASISREYHISNILNREKNE